MKRVCSIFSQVLQLIPRDRFEEVLKEHKAERHARGFNSRGQFVAMLFCQLAQAKSLREITEGLASSLFGVGSGWGVMNREAARRPPSTPALARRSGRIPALPCLPAR